MGQMSFELRADDIDYLRGLPAAVEARNMFGLAPVVKLLVISLLTGGHVLLEGNPGLGKTALVRALADAMGLGRKAVGRIQFTPDLMPADITGTLMPAADGSGALKFRPGPIFHALLIADEINRATPKTQSAMLEAMAEFQVTVLGKTEPLRHARSFSHGGYMTEVNTPFMVMATQNPIDQEGTYDLPEAQSDRFMFKIRMSMPGADVIARIVRKEIAPIVVPPVEPETPLDAEVPLTEAEKAALVQLHNASRAVLSLTLPPVVEAHVVNIVQATNLNFAEMTGLSAKRREALKVWLGNRITYPLGPRAASALAKGALGWSAVDATPPAEALTAAAGARQGLAAVLRPVLRHRLRITLDDLPPEARTGAGEAVALDAFLTELALMSAPDLAVGGEGAGYNDRFRADLASPMAKLAI